jgi:hypothetical protein
LSPFIFYKLKGGKNKKKKKIGLHHRVGHSIYEVEQLLKHLKKNDLNKLLHNFISDKTNIDKIQQFHYYFDKKVLRTLASTLLLDMYLNDRQGVQNIDKMSSINILLKKKNENFSNLLSYMYDVKIKNKKLMTMHQGGVYPPNYYPLGYYIAPIGANAFTAAAIVFLMSMLYKLNKKGSTKIVGGTKMNKNYIINKIKEIISPLHYFNYTKKTISKLGEFTMDAKVKIAKNRKKAKKIYRGGSLLDRGEAQNPKAFAAFAAFADINPAPITWDMRKNLSYNESPTKQLQNQPISQENIGDFIKNGSIYGAVGGKKSKRVKRVKRVKNKRIKSKKSKK